MNEEEKKRFKSEMSLFIKGVDFMPGKDGGSPETALEPVSGCTISKILKKAIETAGANDSGKCYFNFSGGLYVYDDATIEVEAVRGTHDLIDSVIKPALEALRK